ncbi:MAG: two-component system, NtrC family, sensor kinase [Verrucomicrobiota bacterium]|jgi:PAS domain S-box-containing protein
MNNAIPDLNKAEEAVRQSEERYKKLLASVTDYIYSVRLHRGIVLETSHGPGCLSVTGYMPLEYEDDPDLWHRMVHPDDRASVVANAAEMTAGKVPPTIEHRIFHRDGTIRWVRNQRVPHYSPEGDLAGYDGLVSDVTSQKEAEEKLTQANAQLRDVLASLTKSHDELKTTQMQLIESEKLQTMGRMAAGVAHEVKNPLAILQMGLGYLAKQFDPNGDQTSLVLKEMGDAIQRADAVIGDLLEFAAPKQLDLRNREVEPLIRRSLTLVKHELNASKVKVVTNFSGQLPPCPLDRNKMNQAFVNLFTNACHAMPEGGVLTVTTLSRRLSEAEAGYVGGNRSGTRFRAGEEVVMVEIADTGSGIPAEQLSRVFDPYYTTKSTGKGTGLGLTVTKTIIDMHAGRIHIANGSRGGLAVTIVLKSQDENEKS